MKISQSPGQIETSKHLVKSLLSCNSAEEGLGGKRGKKGRERKRLSQKDKYRQRGMQLSLCLHVPESS